MNYLDRIRKLYTYANAMWCEATPANKTWATAQVRSCARACSYYLELMGKETSGDLMTDYMRARELTLDVTGWSAIMAEECR